MPRPGPRLIARVQREAPRVQLHFMQKPHKDSAPFSPPPFTVSLLWHPRLEGDLAHRWLRRCVRSVPSSS